MSRSGYTDDGDDILSYGRWRGAVKSAIEGNRGQALLIDLLAALDAMPDKRLHSGNFATADGEFCTLGVLGAQRGTKMDDLGDAEDGCDTSLVGQRFGIAPAMAAEIMDLNDERVDDFKWIEIEVCGPPRYPRDSHFQCVRVINESAGAERWQYMRKWVAENIKSESSNG